MTHPILLVSSGIFHPPWLGRLWLSRTLHATPKFQILRTPSLESLPKASVESFHALVLYIHHNKISPKALEVLDVFVRQGGGILAIHSASASFQGEDKYFNLLGGRFISHGPVETFQIHPEPGAEAIFDSPTDFTVRDELYRHETLPDIHIHYTTPVQGEKEPVVWTRTHGRGRVCYLSPGHRADSMRHTKIQEIIRQGLAWVCNPQLASQETR